MRLSLCVFGVVGGALALPASLLAQSPATPEPLVRLSMDRRQVLVGQRATLKLEVFAPNYMTAPPMVPDLQMRNAATYSLGTRNQSEEVGTTTLAGVIFESDLPARARLLRAVRKARHRNLCGRATGNAQGNAAAPDHCLRRRHPGASRRSPAFPGRRKPGARTDHPPIGPGTQTRRCRYAHRDRQGHRRPRHAAASRAVFPCQRP